MDRLIEATNRIKALMEVLEDAGFDINEPWSFQNIVVPGNICFATGATRLVIWDDENLDYVAKIALTDEDERYNEHEVELYNAAVEAGLADHFAWCAEIYDYGTHSVYAMEYLDCCEEDIDSASYEWGFKKYCLSENLDPNSNDSKERYSEAYWYDSVYEELVLDWLEDKLIGSVAAKLDSFINRHEINDIHSANLGYRGNQLVLCDYAGYGW